MANILSEKKFERLITSIDWANRLLEFPRNKRVSAVKQFVGNNYFPGGTDNKVPVNMLALAVQIYIRQLAARSPRALFSTSDPGLKSVAADLALAVNQIPKEIGLTETLQELVLEALFSIGIVKVGLHTTGEMLGHEYGKPFVDVVTLDNWFCDMSARRFDEIQYMGNDYWMPYEEVMESGYYEKKLLSDLKPDDYEATNEHGQVGAESIAINETAEEYQKRIKFRDVWLPREELFVTCAVTAKKILKEIEWDDENVKPYYVLGYGKVPGNLLPLAPVSLWRDLHELGNALFRKLARGAENQKTVQGFSGGEEESVNNFKNAKDGDGISWQGGDPKVLKAGGIDQTTLAFYMLVKDINSYVAGNLDSLGGLAPMTQTVGQDKLLSEAASAQMRDMSSKTLDFTRDIFRALAWYEWNDPVGERILNKPIPGLDSVLPVVWDRRSRVGDFRVFDLDIDPHSAQDNSPTLQLQKMNAFLQQYVYPLMPLIEAQGGNLDVRKIIKIATRYADFPEMSEIVTWADREKEPGERTQIQPSGQSTGGPQQRQGMTDRGKSGVMQRLLLGDNPQASEME